MKTRLLAPLVLLLGLIVAPAFVAAGNPIETFGVADWPGGPSASILVAPSRSAIALAAYGRFLIAGDAYTVSVHRNDTCGATGAVVAGPSTAFVADIVGDLHVSWTTTLLGPVDQAGTQRIAIRVVDNAGVTRLCGRVYSVPAGRHWW